MFSPRSLLCSFLSLGATGAIFFSSTPSPSIHTRELLTCPFPRLRLRWDKCVASRFRYRYETSFSFRPTPSPWLFPICLFDVVPRPRAWEALANVDLRVRATWRSVCLSSFPCRSLRSSLVRYCRPFRHLLRLPVSLLRADDVMRFCVPLSSSISGPFPVSPFRSSARQAGRERSVCGELDETARVPMIG